MDISFCVNDVYARYITVTIKSILVNHPNEVIVFYILTDKLSRNTQRLLRESISDYPKASVNIIYVEDTSILHLKASSYLTKYCWYRLFLPKYLQNVKNLLYLDADTLVVGSVKDLFSLNMDGFSIAGCLDPRNFQQETFERLGYPARMQYVCSGVLLLNLDYWRENNLTEKIIKYAEENKDSILGANQDPINYICRNSKIVLPLKYGIMDCYMNDKWKWKDKYTDELNDCSWNPRIIHFAGNAPWKKEFSSRLYHDEWERYNQMLKHPVRLRYATRGWKLVKMLIWNYTHLEGK